ncbi:hypothetical protein D3C87_1630340 [compost metagenome]
MSGRRPSKPTASSISGWRPAGTSEVVATEAPFFEVFEGFSAFAVLPFFAGTLEVAVAVTGAATTPSAGVADFSSGGASTTSTLTAFSNSLFLFRSSVLSYFKKDVEQEERRTIVPPSTSL